MIYSSDLITASMLFFILGKNKIPVRLKGYFDTVCVWEYFQNYEMRLISSLSTNQKENMESDFEENFFIGLVTIILDMILHVWKS